MNMRKGLVGWLLVLVCVTGAVLVGSRPALAQWGQMGRLMEPPVNTEDIDELNAELQPLRSFILPGGSAPAAALHVARTVARRAERVVVELAALPDEPVNAFAIKYINRLSDFE